MGSECQFRIVAFLSNGLKMFHLAYNLYYHCKHSGEQELNFAIVGLPNGGKTTIKKVMNGDNAPMVVPTIGATKPIEIKVSLQLKNNNKPSMRIVLILPLPRCCFVLLFFFLSYACFSLWSLPYGVSLFAINKPTVLCFVFSIFISIRLNTFFSFFFFFIRSFRRVNI